MENEILDAGVSAAIEAGMSIANAARNVGELKYDGQGNPTPFVVIPKNMQVKNLTDMLPPTSRPLPRKKAILRFDEMWSFVDYVNKFNDKRTRLFCDFGSAFMFGAVMDYHNETIDDVQHGQFCEHLAIFTLESTEDADAWVSSGARLDSGAIREKRLSQIEFADFLEDHFCDIYVPDNDPSAPSGATMLEVARTLEAKRDAEFKSGLRLNNGDIDFRFVETTTARAGTKGNLQIPSFFYIKLPLFHGAEPVILRANLRYRLESGQLSFSYRFLQFDRIVREYVQTIRDAIEAKTGITVWAGKLESVSAFIN